MGTVFVGGGGLFSPPPPPEIRKKCTATDVVLVSPSAVEGDRPTVDGRAAVGRSCREGGKNQAL